MLQMVCYSTKGYNLLLHMVINLENDQLMLHMVWNLIGGDDRGVWQIVDLQLFTLIIYIYNLEILTNLQRF